MTDNVTPQQFGQTEGVEGWRSVGKAAFTFFPTGSLATSAELVRAISEADGADGLIPDIDIRPDGVTIRLLTTTTDVFGLTARDVELARRITTIGRDLGLTAVPAAAQSLVVTIDALTIADVLPFWRAVLDYEPRADVPDEELVDPHRRGPVVYFQQMDAPRSGRNRIHLDIWVPLDQAEARVQAAVAAGGHVVTDKYAPGWWVLADAEGNEACIATWIATG